MGPKVPNRDIAVRLASPGIVVGQAGPWCKKTGWRQLMSIINCENRDNWCQFWCHIKIIKSGRSWYIYIVYMHVHTWLCMIDIQDDRVTTSLKHLQSCPRKPLCWCFMTAIRLCESLQWQVMVWEGTENHITSWQIQTYFVDLQHLEIFRVHLKSCIS